MCFWAHSFDFFFKVSVKSEILLRCSRSWLLQGQNKILRWRKVIVTDVTTTSSPLPGRTDSRVPVVTNSGKKRVSFASQQPPSRTCRRLSLDCCCGFALPSPSAFLAAPRVTLSHSLCLTHSLLLSRNSAQDSKESVQGPVVFRRSIFMFFSPPLPPGLCELQVRRERSCPSGLISTL